MNAIGRELKRGMKELERAAGKPVFTWNGNDYPCVENVADSSKVLGLGGFALQADLTLFVRLEVLPTPGPKEKQTLVFDGKTYRIEHAAKLPGDEILRMACIQPTKGS